MDTYYSNEYSRSSILAVRTARRLQQEGVPADEAKRMVIQVINAEEAEMSRQRRSFDELGMAERLNRLPGS